MVSFSPQAWKIIKSKRKNDISAATLLDHSRRLRLMDLVRRAARSMAADHREFRCLALSGFILAMTLLPPREKRRLAEQIDPDARS